MPRRKRAERQISVVLSKETLTGLDVLAVREERYRAEVARRAIEGYVLYNTTPEEREQKLAS